MAIAEILSLNYYLLRAGRRLRQPQNCLVWANHCILYGLFEFGNWPGPDIRMYGRPEVHPKISFASFQTAKMVMSESKSRNSDEVHLCEKENMNPAAETLARQL